MYRLHTCKVYLQSLLTRLQGRLHGQQGCRVSERDQSTWRLQYHDLKSQTYANADIEISRPRNTPEQHCMSVVSRVNMSRLTVFYVAIVALPFSSSQTCSQLPGAYFTNLPVAVYSGPSGDTIIFNVYTTIHTRNTQLPLPNHLRHAARPAT